MGETAKKGEREDDKVPKVCFLGTGGEELFRRMQKV